ncbi:hypothetical protein TGGT1_257170 [Toxoplasma gondii GT1]|uniref:Uncharacterized protein n=2 Tax=Toxoplasma gondii TaxID=5811 RepID=S7UZD1_TOXGG|nr:hypothetical protein TGGT1_257170 [Toxoplasma gondii GT1]KAF4641449.1 hypothetical protein TGRH88_072590 [Toxoplasma gondii]
MPEDVLCRRAASPSAPLDASPLLAALPRVCPGQLWCLCLLLASPSWRRPPGVCFEMATTTTADRPRRQGREDHRRLVTCQSPSSPPESPATFSEASRSAASSASAPYPSPHQSAPLHFSPAVDGAAERVCRSRVLLPAMVVFLLVYVHLSHEPVANNHRGRGGIGEDASVFCGCRGSRSSAFGKTAECRVRNLTSPRTRRQTDAASAEMLLPTFLHAAASPRSSFVGKESFFPFSYSNSKQMSVMPSSWQAYKRDRQVPRRPRLATLMVSSPFLPAPPTVSSPAPRRGARCQDTTACPTLHSRGATSAVQASRPIRDRSLLPPHTVSSSFLLCSPASSDCSSSASRSRPSSQFPDGSASFPNSSFRSTVSSQSTRTEAAKQPLLRVILKTATGCPELDFSLHFDLPFDATVSDLRRALQVRLRQEEERLLAALTPDPGQVHDSRSSAESNGANLELSGSEQKPDETSHCLHASPSRVSSSSASLPLPGDSSASSGPPLSLLRLLHGGASVDDASRRLSTLLPAKSGESGKLPEGQENAFEAPQPLVFLLDLPIPPLVLSRDANLSPANASPSEAASEESSASRFCAPLSTRVDDIAAAQTGALQEIIDVLLRLQEARLSLTKKARESVSGRSPGSSPDSPLFDAVWGNTGLPLQSSENVLRRVEALKRAAASRRTSLGDSRCPSSHSHSSSLEPPSVPSTSPLSTLPCPSSSPPPASSASLSSSPSPCVASSSGSSSGNLVEFPRLAPTLGDRLRQVSRVTFDVDWPWIARVGCISFVLQALLGCFASSRVPVTPASGREAGGGDGDSRRGSAASAQSGGMTETGDGEAESRARRGGWAAALLRSLQENISEKDSTFWRRRMLLAAAPALVLSGWRPVRFLRKLISHSLPRGQWWTALSPLLTSSQTATLTINEEAVLQVLADERAHPD